MLFSDTPKQPVIAAAQPKLVGLNKRWVGPKSKKELAAEYKKSRNTIAEWCQAIGIKTNKRLSLSQVMAVYRHYGWPGDYEVMLAFE